MTGSQLHGLDDESRQMIVDTVTRLKERLLNRESILKFDKEETFPEDVIREMLGPEIGLQLIFIPEEYGGMGGGARDCCMVTREMARICLGVTTAFFAIQLGADPLFVGGTEAQKEKWLGKIAEGDCLVAYAVTEPGAGSNLAAITTKAEPVADDSGNIEGYTINGTKQFISNGGYADFITVLAKTPQGPAFFIVEKDAPGFAVGKAEEKHGIRASNTSPLVFTDLYVPVENLIGEKPGMGLKQANQVFGYTRLMVASMALGAGEAAMQAAVSYAKERIQFGGPLSEKQGYTHKLIISNLVRLEAASAYIDEIAFRLDEKEGDLQVEGSIAKYFTSESANKAADDAIQALGGYGYISEFMVEKIKRDVKITCIYEGTSEIQQNIISTFRWKKTRKSKGDHYNAIALDMDKIDSLNPDIGCRLYGLAARALNEIILLVHENRLTRQQYVMFALADMIAWTEIGACFACRTHEYVRKGGDNTAASAKSRIFAAETGRIFGQNIMAIVAGSGLFDQKKITEFSNRVRFSEIIGSCQNMITDMDRVADMVFER
ncbi:acyl-CoA dehydrogenase family protein [Desulfobacterales bacterium HSG16]|nr:acyl-CoA dehydrogenase family protein [Desulfobacterales bacterium HSG16]